ncbi:TrkA family potassium uptake protein [Erythrobacter sp. YT30]|uniref:potassium channel family protein n=1 Tax=Erythrobacter sp. YT30 TaxID=1735012 RepID=UPI00076CB5FF|nr:TrkA family potassium uptake protein [Erythrobacter sp. YT30]KWV92005.1 potassium transporter [Erythrobacter sp. YT30]
MSAETREPVLVIGLGRFGSSVALALEKMGHEVLATDNDPRLVKEFASSFTQVVEADCTEANCLTSLGASSFETAVVAIGGDIEASLLAVLALVDMGVPNIWAKANNEGHARILERTGAHHVVFPEQKMGEQVAHLVNERLLDFMSFSDEFSIARLKAPAAISGKPLSESNCRKKYAVTVIGVKREGQDFIHAVPETVVEQDDELVVSGKIEKLEAFAAIRS